MYRAYACGVGLPQRPADMHWQNFLQDNHHRRMREMKTSLDTKAPIKRPHLQANLKKQQMDEERYTWIERDNHHILGQLAKVTETSTSPPKQILHKQRSMIADGQRKEQERIAADNHRLHRALNRIKPTVPSVKDVEIRTKELERWYKNGCKLPDVLYDTSSNGGSPGTVLPPISSPLRQNNRSHAQRDNAMNSGSIVHNLVKLNTHSSAQHNSVSKARLGDNSVAASEFHASKSLMGRLRPEILGNVCDIKQPPAPLRQLLQAACAALGEPSHAIACLDCMSDHLTSQRLARFQAAAISTTDADAFMAHMNGYKNIDASILQIGIGAQAGIKALQAWCLALRHVLCMQQQQLLIPNQSHERQNRLPQQKTQQHRGRQQAQRQHGNNRINVEGLIADDDGTVSVDRQTWQLPGAQISSSYLGDDIIQKDNSSDARIPSIDDDIHETMSSNGISVESSFGADRLDSVNDGLYEDVED